MKNATASQLTGRRRRSVRRRALSSDHRLEENVGGATVNLTPEDLRDVEEAASKILTQYLLCAERGLEYAGHL